MRLPSRSAALLAAFALGLSACAADPGPFETSHQAELTACATGDKTACVRANHLAPQVQAEREQRQKQAAASGVLAAIVAGLALIAVAAAGGGRGDDRYHHRRHRW